MKCDKFEFGDVVIRKEIHSCDVRFVESSDEYGVLLVNGIADRYYTHLEFDKLYDEYELLCKRCERRDTYK